MSSQNSFEPKSSARLTFWKVNGAVDREFVIEGPGVYHFYFRLPLFESLADVPDYRRSKCSRIQYSTTGCSWRIRSSSLPIVWRRSNDMAPRL